MKQERGIPAERPSGGGLVGDGGSEDEQGFVGERPPEPSDPGAEESVGDGSHSQRPSDGAVEVEPRREDPTDEPH